jgi:hypothetical protein
MTELKSDSQSIRTVQTQPSTRKRSAKSTSASPQVAASGGNEVESESEEVAPKRKRRNTSKTASQKSKRQATTKATTQTASTQVKLAWELSQSSMAARFAQLEHELQHYRNEVDAILTEMEALKTLSERLDRQVPPRTGLKLPMETLHKVHDSDLELPTSHVSQAVSPDVPQSQPQTKIERTPQKVEPEMVRQSTVPKSEGKASGVKTDVRRSRNQPTNQTSKRSTPKTRSTSRSVTTTRPRRRFPLERLGQRIVTLPKRAIAVPIDAVLWVLAAAGLRIALKQLVFLFPVLTTTVNVLIFVPALMAIVAALFLPGANRVGIYRLLLVALGLFVGGKL